MVAEAEAAGTDQSQRVPINPRGGEGTIAARLSTAASRRFRGSGSGGASGGFPILRFLGQAERAQAVDLVSLDLLEIAVRRTVFRLDRPLHLSALSALMPTRVESPARCCTSGPSSAGSRSDGRCASDHFLKPFVRLSAREMRMSRPFVLSILTGIHGD